MSVNSLAPGAARPLGRVSTTDAIVNELTRTILDGTIEPGTPLREVELSERFGVSRQSLRAALAELAFQGLAQREPHRGVMVPVLTRADAEDMHYVRTLIEGEAVRKLAVTPAAWPAVEAAVVDLEQLPASAPWSVVADADAAVHRAAVAAAQSTRLSRLHGQIINEIRLLIVPTRHFLSQEKLAQEHRELFDVICEGDPDAAYGRLIEHLELGLGELIKRLPDGSGEPVRA